MARTLNWVGTSATWATASNWIDQATGVAALAAPTNADICRLGVGTGATNNACTTSAGDVCGELNIDNSYSGTLTLANSATALTVGGSALGAVHFGTGMTLTNAGTSSTVVFASTSTNGGAGWAFTTGGKTMPHLTFSGTGKWVFQDACTTMSNGVITHQHGTVDTGNQTINCSQFTPSGSNGTLTLGTSTLTLTLSGDAWQCSNAFSITISAASSTINLTGNNANFRHGDGGNGSATFGTVNFNPAGTGTFSASINNGATSVLTFATLTFVGFASKTYTVTIKNPITVNTAFKIAGNSVTNRILASSTTVGSATAITLGASATCKTAGTQHVDFMDITLSGGAANERDLSAITGNSGDCGGNTGITFTVSATQTSTGTASFTWSTHGWTSRVPLPQDDVSIPNAFIAGRTITADMPRIGRSITCTCTGSPIFDPSVALRIFGSLTFVSGMTASPDQTVTFSGRGSYTITSAGVIFGRTETIAAPGGTYTLQDAFAASPNAAGLTISSGTFDTNSQSVSLNGALTINGGTLTAGTTNFLFTQAANPITFWSYTSGTVNCSTCTITVSGATTIGRTFAGGGQTYGSLTNTVANSPGILSITGSNTWAGTWNIGSGRIVQCASGATQTFTAANALGGVAGSNRGYLRIPNVNTEYASVPHSAALVGMSSLTILARFSLDDWTPTAISAAMGKWGSTVQSSYRMLVNTAGTIRCDIGGNGTLNTNYTSTAAPVIADGATLWVLFTWRNSDGRGQFFTASGAIADPVASDFTQLGADVTSAPTAGTVISGAAQSNILGFGLDGNSISMAGNFYRAKVYDGAFSTAAFGGTKQLDADFTTKAFGVNTFTESSSNAATVTINGTLGQAGDGRVVLQAASGTTTLNLTGPQVSVMRRTVPDHITVSPQGHAYAVDSVDGGNNTGLTFQPFGWGVAA